ncbi:wax ester/triacylglycerol synthase family O-acyltransferase [Actinomadura craniellae]|uniref:Diacylglycerol O-acyltransferase n=1 Tax=Actinomadura craniellae TaxID=2231787 RepID=A0A365H2H3_9ACTN|nr:wax ester/triacylglycerol synthase family O-acyltransferase [Actinomadura craniellae]RAY13226.1 wax ester/triacylglycerol synthase family O-acyltransferase [Actinomadura craniellae]
MERMNSLDAGFFFAETENHPLHIASVTVFEGPAPTYGDLIRLVLSKLGQVPRYRQRVRTVPLNLGRPVWVDDPHFQIRYHVRHTAVPRPGGPDQLRNLAGRVLSQRLDPDRPLWEIWLVEGLAGDGRWAMITKVHHCVVDGIGGVDLLTALFDLDPGAEPPAAPAELPPAEPAPSGAALLAGAATEPLRQLAGLPGAARAVLDGRALRTFGLGLPRAIGRLVRPASSSLNGPVGPHRRWLWARAELAEIKRVRTALGGTVNDVVLAAVTGGFRELLAMRGELSPTTVVRALVPVSVRTLAEGGALANRVSGVLVNLPAGEEDPARRLFLLRAQMNGIKRTHEAVGGEALVRLAGFAPTLLALGSRAALSQSQPLIQTVVTNVPGPQFPLYVLGRRMVELYPYVPLAMGIRVAVAVFSYEGTLHFGLTGDFDGMPDLDVLATGIETGFDELRTAAKHGPVGPVQTPAGQSADDSLP